jgi:type IV secretion system protein VirB10
MATALANEINQVGTKLLNENMAIQPTITIRLTYAFDVFVNQTIILQPYANPP